VPPAAPLPAPAPRARWPAGAPVLTGHVSSLLPVLIGHVSSLLPELIGHVSSGAPPPPSAASCRSSAPRAASAAACPPPRARGQRGRGIPRGAPSPPHLSLLLALPLTLPYPPADDSVAERGGAGREGRGVSD